MTIPLKTSILQFFYDGCNSISIADASIPIPGPTQSLCVNYREAPFIVPDSRPTLKATESDTVNDITANFGIVPFFDASITKNTVSSKLRCCVKQFHSVVHRWLTASIRDTLITQLPV